MITKAFELRANVSYFVPAPSVRLCKETLMPVSKESKIPSFSFNHRLSDFVSFMGIFHGTDGLKTVVISNDHETVFLWRTGSVNRTYRIKSVSLSLSQAFENLTKAYFTDSKIVDSVVGKIIKDIVCEWLFTTPGLKFEWTLACKWRGEFVYFEVVKESFNATSIKFIPFGKKSFHSDLKEHPQDVSHNAERSSSKI